MRQPEGLFKADTIHEIEQMFDGAIVLTGNAQSRQGIPDTVVLWRDRWAALEFKRNARAIHQPNQDYYVNLMDRMSFADFIFPENRGEVLHALQSTFESRR